MLFVIFFIIYLMFFLLGDKYINVKFGLKEIIFKICFCIFSVYVVFKVSRDVFGKMDCSFLMLLNYFLNVFL